MREPLQVGQPFEPEEVEELRRDLRIYTMSNEEIEALKHDINTLVWKHLPGSTTLKEADSIAVRIFDIIAG